MVPTGGGRSGSAGKALSTVLDAPVNGSCHPVSPELLYLRPSSPVCSPAPSHTLVTHNSPCCVRHRAEPPQAERRTSLSPGTFTCTREQLSTRLRPPEFPECRACRVVPQMTTCARQTPFFRIPTSGNTRSRHKSAFPRATFPRAGVGGRFWGHRPRSPSGVGGGFGTLAQWGGQGGDWLLTPSAPVALLCPLGPAVDRHMLQRRRPGSEAHPH